MEENYYSLLDIERSASQDEIKKAYRKKAMQYHPDKNPNDAEAEEMFKKVSAAYSVLSNPDEKAYYDRTGSTKGNYSGNININDVFGDLFGNMRGNPFNFDFKHQQRQHYPFMNIDIKLHMRISFKDAVMGGKANVKFKRQIACKTCKGTSYIPKDEKCANCYGMGFTEQIFQSIIGLNKIQVACDTCFGTGKTCEQCKDCSGKGYTQKECKITVDIPAGLRPNSQLSVKNMGNELYFNGAKHIGTVYIIVDFPQEQNGVILKGGNLHIAVNISIDKVLSDEEVIVDVLGFKDIKLKLDHKNPNGHVYSIKNENNTGFYFIKVFLDLPENNISKENREKLITILKEIYGKTDKKIKPIPISTIDAR